MTFKRKPMENLTGHLLIAIPDLGDPNFSKTVVMMFQHNEEGASGVILNRPSDVNIKRVWDEVADEPCDCEDPVNIGGPVQGPLIALHGSLELAETPVVSGVFISVGRENLNELVHQTAKPFKLFSGYSGWGSGQLESEIQRGGWLTLKATAGHVFDSPDGLWRQVCDQVGNDVLKSQLGNHWQGDASLN